MAEERRGFAGYGYETAGGDRVTALRDMIDGGGKGRSGGEFEGGGILSLIANMVASPYGSERERSFGMIPGERSPQAPMESFRPMQRPAVADPTAADVTAAEEMMAQEDLLMGMPVTPLSPGVAANATLNPGLAGMDLRQLLSDPRVPAVVQEKVLEMISRPVTSGMA